MAAIRNKWGKVWEFKTARFEVSLRLIREPRYKYDGDDESGEIQDKLDSGEYVAFNSLVTVTLDEVEISHDSLGGSVYTSGETANFWRDHRSSDPMNRNCSIMRAVKGGNVCICHYFPDMVRNAIREARQHIAAIPDKPRLRQTGVSNG